MNLKLARVPIRRLPESLANQIAAGEVIERPASVVKELVENSLDAHADQIQIELDKGGMQRIEVVDNGSGIACDELPLAVAAHATSKLAGPDSLMRIASLGFRGEALASICAVSHWRLTSCAQDAEQAWLLTHDQRRPRPAAHPSGTRVQVGDLFHNIPARRKFLRTEQTEYRHIDTVFRRLALSQFAVGFTLKHNGRMIHQLSAAHDRNGRERRIRKLCGKRFLEHAVWLEVEWQGMRLFGWLGRSDYSRPQGDVQYFFVNGRIIRDRIINHAIRQAYQSELYPGRFPAFVLYLDLPLDEVDVNVHPTKHEVRFRQSRRVHDFLSRALREMLYPDPQSRLLTQLPVYQDRYHPPATGASSSAGVGESGYRYPSASPQRDGKATSARPPVGRCVALLFSRFALFHDEARYWLIDLHAAMRRVTRQRLRDALSEGPLKRKPLLIPVTLNLDPSLMPALESGSEALQRFGIESSQAGPGSIMLRTMPAILSGYVQPDILLPVLIGRLEQGAQDEHIIELLAEHSAEQVAVLDVAGVERVVGVFAASGLPLRELARPLEPADLKRLTDCGRE